MADLITSARAKQAIAQGSFTSAENTAIASIVTAVSDAIRRFCRREFDSQSFDELYNGSGRRRLLLRQFPILAVSRVAASPTTVLRITNTSSSNQRATVAVTSTGLSLTRVASGSSSTDTSITWAGNATLAAVANAVNALGNGWSATAEANYSLWPSADLRSLQGALNAKDRQAELKLHVEELSNYQVHAEAGILLIGTTQDSFFDTGYPLSVWTPGIQNYRVVYTAGFSTVPEPVQEAAAQWVAALFWQTKRDPGLAQEQVVGAVFRTPHKDWPPESVRQLLVPYRVHPIAAVRGG